MFFRQFYSYMIKQLTNKELSTFNIYVDLFNTGEFNEMIITRNSDDYQINIEDTYLGTLSQKSDNNWEVTGGTIPSFIIPAITRNIKFRTA